MKNRVLLFASVFLFLVATPVLTFAESENSGSGSSNSTSTPRPTKSPEVDHILRENEGRTPQGMVKRQENSASQSARERETKERRAFEDSSRSAFLKKREDLKEELKTRIETAKKEWETKHKELIDNLKKIKDEKKVTIVENIDARIAERNTHWVQHWSEVLTRQTQLLDKIEAKAKELQGQGKDITTVTTAIAAARTAITNAQAKVDAQAGKTYHIDVTTETTLGSNVSAAVKQMQADVKTVISAIEEVRKATQSAINALKTVLGLPISSPTASPVATTQP
jgi:flagellar motility protein MotE (MotC chaperone)